MSPRTAPMPLTVLCVPCAGRLQRGWSCVGAWSWMGTWSQVGMWSQACRQRQRGDGFVVWDRSCSWGGEGGEPKELPMELHPCSTAST